MLLSSLLMVGSASFSHCDECWLRDDTRQNPAMIEYLQQQNQHAEAYLSSLASQRDDLVKQWKNTPQEKASEPWLKWYGRHYKVNKNGKGQLISLLNGKETVLVDFNQRAQGWRFYRYAAWAISENHRFVALAENTTGDDHYTISVIDVKTGKTRYHSDHQYSTDIQWIDNNHLVVIKNDSQTYRPYQVEVVSINTKTSTVIYKEKDPAWLVSAYSTTDNNDIVIQTNNDNSSEQYFLNKSSFSLTANTLTLIKPRQENTEYYVDRINNNTWVNSNIQGAFALYRINKNKAWSLLIKPEGEIEKWRGVGGYILLQTKQQGKTQLTAYTDSGKKHFVRDLSANASTGWLSHNTDKNSDVVTIRTMGLKQPPAWQTLSLEDGHLVATQADQYSQFDPNDYVATQISVNNAGVTVPVSLLYKKSALTETSPVILYGYGAYGVTMRPYFMPQIVSLADKGAIYAIAHVRGGGFKGEPWHKAGSGIHRQQSIADYVAVAKAMKHFRPQSTADHTAQLRDVLAIGGSAGGTLIAAAINQQPQLFKAAVLQVPFVDVLASMSDPSLPLTEQQYGEWGNPNDVQQRKVMQQYSPFDNITAQPYPALLVRSGLHDSRVPFWEAAKYMMRIQSYSTAKAPYLLATDLQAGHRSDSRRALYQQAEDYLFLLQQTGKQ